MAVTHKGAISFGLVHIPVELHLAVREAGVSFNQVIRDEDGSLSRVQYKKVCARTGREVRQDEICKGYQYDRDRYILVSDEELEALKSEKDRNITIVQFAPLDSIPTLYLNKAYHCLPQKGGEKPFELLRKVMLRKKRVALGRTVLGQTERLVALIPTDAGMLVQSLYYEADIRDLPHTVQRPQIAQGEMAMAEQLVESMQAPFDVSQYRDQYQDKVNALIQSKLEGSETHVAKPAAGGSVLSLMDALKASLEAGRTGLADNAQESGVTAPKTRKKVLKHERKLGKTG